MSSFYLCKYSFFFCWNFLVTYTLYVNIAGRLQVLYTDYNFALVYACMLEPPVNGKCPRDQSRVVVYGRQKWNDARLPDHVRQYLEPVANDACLYLEDFAPAALPPGHNFALLTVLQTTDLAPCPISGAATWRI